ncbi:MAG: PKD domain-containing protein [Methanobacteriota archaeon]|nr:MAG: PKD domain-containing protein [Euryarchaeota archaeon]
MRDSEGEPRFGRTTKMSIFVVFAMVAAMFAGPSLVTNGNVEPPVMNASAVDPSRIFTVGTVELAISTLSPFTYTMADEWMVIFPCYSYLLTLDENAEVVGDLATSWEMSPDGLTWTFEIVDNAYFINRTDEYSTEHPVTIDDVIFTFNLIQDYESNLHFYFPGEIDGYPDTIESMTKINDYKMELTLSGPYAPFYNAIQSIPIFPQYWWEPRVLAEGNPGDVSVENDPEGGFPIGSGFLYYDLDGLSETEEYSLIRNPTWFQEEQRGWQLHIEEFKLKEMGDAGTAWLELKQGTIDCFMGVSPSVYVNDLPGTPDVIGFAQSTGFVYEYNLNQMTDEMRAELGGAFTNGYNSQLLLDPVIREAIAMCVDKTGFISQVLLGLGTVADSLIPDINPWHYTYGSAPGEVPVPFDPDGARQMLIDNGWKYDAAGRENIPDDQCPLYGYVDGVLTPLEFRFTTLNTEDEWMTAGSVLKTWAAEGGVKLNLEIKSSSEMNSDWYSADYDLWIWDWIFTPLSDPSTDVLSVLTTQEIGTWSDLYWSSPVFDDLYNQSLTTMDPVERQLIVDEMQRMVYEDHACQLVAYRKELYAVSEKYWTGYGDWNTKWVLMPDQTYPYTYMQISPNGVDEPKKNTAPEISFVTVPPGTVGDPVTFAAGATDESVLNYRWFFGDGTSSGWLSSPSTTHTYATDGVYEVWLAVKETTGDDLFVSSATTQTTITDLSNTPPYDLSIDYLPASPDTGDVVTFTGSATDDDGDLLYYSWEFGDGFTGMGNPVTHQYVDEGTYTVNMSVTDNRYGYGERPATDSKGIAVTPNGPPTISVPDYTDIEWKTEQTYTVTANDPDAGDTLRYTWAWGDGSVSVTTTPSTTHSYDHKETYLLTVYADDLSNLPGHNVSDTGYVYVIGGENKLPTIEGFDVSDVTPYTGQPITISASAKDGDGDSLRFTFWLGDGTCVVFDGPTTQPNALVTFEFDTTYATSGWKTVSVYVDDGTDNVTTTTIPVDVTANSAPEFVTDPVDYDALEGELLDFLGDAFDPDMTDVLTYTWDFGDGTSTVVGNPVSHTYTDFGEYVYTVTVDDAHGHVISAAAIVYVGVPYDLDLEAGWNLVSIPLVNHGYNASNLGLSFGDMLSRWDPATQTYDKNYIVGISGFASDFDIEPSWSYWIYSGSAKLVELRGHEPDPLEMQIRPITVPSGGGWVQVGLASLQTTLWASDIELMYTIDQLTMVSRWNAASQTYSNYLVELGIGDFQLSPGDGLWLYVEITGVFAYEP